MKPRIPLKRNAPWYPAAWVVLAAVIWATDSLVRPKVTGLSPASVVFIEHVLGLILVAPVVLYKYGRAVFRINLREAALLALIGLGGGVLGGVFFNQSTQAIGIGFPTLIVMAQPAAVVILAYLFLRERMDSAFFPLSFWVILNALLIAYPLLEQGVAPQLSETFFSGIVWAVSAALMLAVAPVSGKAVEKAIETAARPSPHQRLEASKSGRDLSVRTFATSKPFGIPLIISRV